MVDGELIDTRPWDALYEAWLFTRDESTRPGPHPDKNHVWNTHPEMFQGNFKSVNSTK